MSLSVLAEVSESLRKWAFSLKCPFQNTVLLQGMMGVAVLCARLQNLYDWQPYSSHVVWCCLLLFFSFIQTHISSIVQLFRAQTLVYIQTMPLRTFRIILFYLQEALIPLKHVTTTFTAKGRCAKSGAMDFSGFVDQSQFDSNVQEVALFILAQNL